MKKLLLVIIALAASAFAQTTPNIGLNIPSHGTPNWDTLMNSNFNALDNFLSGNATLPALHLSGNITVGSCTGCGAGSIFQVGGTGLTSSTTINFQAGTLIGITNPSAGNISIAFTGTMPVTLGAVAHNFFTSYTSSTGVFTAAQPAFTDISGSVAAGQMPALTGDVTSSAGNVATTVAKINGTSLAGLATGIIKNTTGTGQPRLPN